MVLTGTDRRRWERYNVDWPFFLRGCNPADKTFATVGVLHDISVRGAFGYCADPPQLAMKLEILIRIPLKGEQWMKYSAEVARVETGIHGTSVALIFDSAQPLFCNGIK